MTALPLHVVQIGWDTSLLDARSASDTRQRQIEYARLLDRRRPGSRMSLFVLGAAADSRPFQHENLTAVPIAGRWSGLARLGREVRTLHRKSPISLIATQSPLEEAWVMLAVARGRIPVLAQVHFDVLSRSALPGGSTVRAIAGRIRLWLALELLPRYRAVRCVAPEMAEGLRALGARNLRCVPVPVPDLAGFGAVADTPREKRVLFVGRLAPEKNLELWLEVARRVLDILPATRFDIVGGGALQDRLVARAGELGLGSAIEFHGSRQRAELPALYGRAAVLLLTSDHEGFGRVLVEALAAGTAVVSTRTSGAREVLGEGEAGLLADCGDAGALAQAVISLLGEPQKRAALVTAGQRRIKGRYDPLRLTNEWIDMLIEAAEFPPTTR